MPTTFPLQSLPLLHITFKAQFPQIRIKPIPAFFSKIFSKSATRINQCLGNLMLKFKDSAQTEHHSGMSPYVRPQSQAYGQVGNSQATSGHQEETCTL